MYEAAAHVHKMSRIEVEDDGEIHNVLIKMVTLNEETLETLKVIDPEDLQQQNSVFIKPYHNCLDMDSQHLGKLN